MQKQPLLPASVKTLFYRTALSLLFLLPSHVVFSEEPVTPEKSHRISGPVIARLLGQYHYNHQKINDQVSSETFDLYLESLDRSRMYFLASDVASFEQYRDKLDDEILSGEFEAAYLIFNTLVKRLEQRLEFVNNRLDMDFDFSLQEELEVDRSEKPWARNSAELDELWRRKLKNEALNLKLNNVETEEIKSKLLKRYSNLHTRIKQYNAEDVFQFFVNAVSETFDPHTSYFSPIASENFNIDMRLSFEGIGAQLTTEDEYTKVVRILPGGPAERSKELWANDKIVGVAQGKDSEMVDVIGWRLDDVVQKIRGEKGTTVRLEIISAAGTPGSPTKEISLVRDKIILEEKAAKSDTVEIMHDSELFRLGVIDIPSFYIDLDAQRRGDRNYKSTTRDVRRLLGELEGAGVDGIIIDLRRNGGGSLQEAIELTGLFIEKGPVVQVKDSRGKKGVEYDPDPALVYNGPLAVLVDRFSASASEIFSSAIQDYGRGIIVGSQTYGKGTVQRLLGLDRFINSQDERFGQVKVTTAKFYRVTGGTTQNLGVIPDISFPNVYNEMDIYGENNKLHALPWDEISPAMFTPDDRISRHVAELRTRSKLRIAENREFKFALEDIQEFKHEEERNSISLNETERKQKREEQRQKNLQRVNQRRIDENKEPYAKAEDIPRDEPVPDAWLTETEQVLADLISFSDGRSPALTKTENGEPGDSTKKEETVKRKN